MLVSVLGVRSLRTPPGHRTTIYLVTRGSSSKRRDRLAHALTHAASRRVDPRPGHALRVAQSEPPGGVPRQRQKVDTRCLCHMIVAMIRRKKPNPLVHRVMVRLPDDLMRALEKAAAEDRRRLSDFVRIVLEDHLAARGKRKGR